MASKNGLGRAYGLYLGDETGALLTGARVEAELGMPIRNGRVASYLRDPGLYQDNNIYLAPAYAVGMTREEMRDDPLGALQARREQVAEHKEGLAESIQELEAATGKKASAERLAELERLRKEAGVQDESLRYLDQFIAYYSQAQNADALKKAAADEQFAEWEAAIEEHSAYLKTHMGL